MKISTQCKFFLKNISSRKEVVDILAEAGYDCIDFSFFELPCGDNLENEFAELKKYAASLGVTFNQAHAPFPTSVGDEEKDREIFGNVVRAMELASILGVKHIIVHPKEHLNYKGNEELLKKINFDFYTSLIPYCEKYNIKVAIENMWQWDTNRSCISSSTCALPAEHAEYVDMLNSPWFVACLDIGHAALVGEDITVAIKTLGHDRLKALHVHDVDYKKDKHTLPGVEKLNYTEIAEALNEIDYDGELTLEADEFLCNFEKGFWCTAARFMADRARFIANMIESK